MLRNELVRGHRKRLLQGLTSVGTRRTRPPPAAGANQTRLWEWWKMRISMRGTLPVLVAGAALAACSGDARRPPPPRGFTQYDAVVRVATPDSVEFTRVQAMDVDSRGNLYVADHTDIAVLSPEAKLLRRLGRAGKGPGEFDDVSSVRVLPGDSVFAFDGGAARVTVFAPESERPAHMLSLSTANYVFPYWVMPVSDGSLMGVFRAAYADSPRGRRRDTVRLLNPDASVAVDSVLAFPEYEAVEVEQGPVGGALFSPFGQQTLLANAGDRVYTAWTGSWQVEVYSARGKHLGTVHPQDPPQPLPVTGAEMDSVVTRMQRGGPFERQTIVRALEGAGRKTWPLLDQMLVDDSGRIWMAPTARAGEPLHWAAFDEQGRRVGAFQTPARVKLHLIRGDVAYGVALDGDDVQHVVVYDLKPVHPEPKRT